MRRRRPRLAVLAACIAVAVAVGGCGGPSPRTTFPPLGSTPVPVGDATAATRGVLVAAFASIGMVAAESARAYRPAEGPLLAAAPRTVLQVVTANDPEAGYVLIYAFPSEQVALAAAQDHAAYVASGPGRIQFPNDARHILKVVGNTVVSFWWTPAGAQDASVTEIENVIRLSVKGLEVPVAGT